MRLGWVSISASCFFGRPALPASSAHVCNVLAVQMERAGRIEPSKGGVEGLATIDDAELLMEIMEARELVDSTEVHAAINPALAATSPSLCSRLYATHAVVSFENAYVHHLYYLPCRTPQSCSG